jgi:hypothetical protein
VPARAATASPNDTAVCKPQMNPKCPASEWGRALQHFNPDREDRSK